MLIITRQQKARFAALERAALTQDVLDHLREALPEVWASCSDQDGLVAAAYGLERAEAHGLDSFGSVLRFCEVMSLTGPDLGDPDTHAALLDVLYHDEADEDWPETREALVRLYEELAS